MTWFFDPFQAWSAEAIDSERFSSVQNLVELETTGKIVGLSARLCGCRHSRFSRRVSTKSLIYQCCASFDVLIKYVLILSEPGKFYTHPDIKTVGVY